MEQNKRNVIISIILVLLAIFFTILVKVVDVKNIGPNESSVGFATINGAVASNIGVNENLYKMTNYLGLFLFVIVAVYAIMGLFQLIKRKSLFKVDNEIIYLAFLYIITMALYLFFEKVIINYRPILVEGLLEASYPSSHTMITICICGSAIILNKIIFNNKLSKILNVLILILAILIIVCRILSGYHWFTDILGGVLISSALLMCYYTIIKRLRIGKHSNK